MSDNDMQVQMTDESGQESGVEFVTTGPAPEYLAQGSEVVNYFFPVEIVISGTWASREREAIQAQIFQDLHDAIVRKLA